MCLVPVNLGASNVSCSKTNHSGSLYFAPPPTAVYFTKPPQVSDSGADGNCFNVGDITDDLEGVRAIPSGIRSLLLCRCDAYTSVQMPMAINPIPAR